MKIAKPIYYEDKILQVINDNPNINSKGLRDKVGISKNIISKRLNLLRWDKMISKSIKAGKKKTFFARENRHRDCVFNYETYRITNKGRKFLIKLLKKQMEVNTNGRNN